MLPRFFALIALASVLMIGLFGCGITDPINKVTLKADGAEMTSDAGAIARVPTLIIDEDGNPFKDSITVKTPGGLDIYNVDKQGIYGASSQPKAVMTLPFTDPPAVIASPSDITIGKLVVPVKVAEGEYRDMEITELTASVSAPISALTAQVVAVLDATKHLSTDERIRKIEQMRIAGEITAQVASEAIKAIITGVTGIPQL